MDSKTGEIGGFLPTAEAEFVRDKMTTDFLRREDAFQTVRERLSALRRSGGQQSPFTVHRFVAFPNAAIYPPALYIPQVIAIRLVGLFTQQVYIIFYAARIFNAVTAVALISLALYLARGHQYLLLFPAALPTSFYQIASVSSDACVIALSVLFVGVCLRFEHADGRGLRFSLLLSSLLLTLGKPVYLPIVLLPLISHCRLGWKRAAAFCTHLMVLNLLSYFLWSCAVRSFLTKPQPDAKGADPFTQIHYLVAHPTALFGILRATMASQGPSILGGTIGFFGSWGGLPLPTWFYVITSLVAVAVVACVIRNAKTFNPTRLILALLAAISMSIAVLLAAYVLWTPPGSVQAVGIQGRYLIPILFVSVFGTPSLGHFRRYSGLCVQMLSIGFFLASVWWTTQIVGAYYFPASTIVGQNVHNLFDRMLTDRCPASIDLVRMDWFTVLEGGRLATNHLGSRVILTDEAGTVLGESDARLIGNDPYEWRARIWMPNKSGTVTSWVIQSASACPFGTVEVKPSNHP